MNDKTSKPVDSSEETANLVALLAAISGSDQHTQRSLAVRLGVALGLANALLRRCAAKGLIKIQDAPARRYAYYLTPKGFAEKTRLVAEYLTSSLSFFRDARGQYEEAFLRIAASGKTRVAIVGSGELAEIALLSASAANLSVVAVIAPGRNEGRFHGHPVVADLSGAQALGAEIFVIADTTAPQTIYDRLREEVAAQFMVAPPLLHIVTQAAHKSTQDAA